MLFENLNQMPIDRYQAFGKALVRGHHIDGSPEGIPKSLHAVRDSIMKQDNNATMKHATNALNAWIDLVESFSPKCLAFGCLVYRVKGENREDFSEEGIKETCRLYTKTGITVGEVSDIVEEVKKKLLMNLPLSFLIEAEIVKPSDILAT